MPADIPTGQDPDNANRRVAAVFDEIADLLEVQGGNGFRVRAYRNAARNVGSLGRSVVDMLRAGENLAALRGIGKDLANKIVEISTTGSCAQLETLRHGTPVGVAELLQLPGLGPRRVQSLHDRLGVGSIADLQMAAEQDRIRTVPGFGPVMQRRLREALQQRVRSGRRFPLPLVAPTVAALLGFLRQLPAVQEAVVAGSFRRCRDTLGDVDLLVATTAPAAVTEAFARHAGVTRVLAHGGTRASVELASGLQVDLRAVAPESFGAALLYFTGSKAHNIALRRIAQDAGCKLNEYGLFRGAVPVAGRTEEAIYHALGLPTIPPELREDAGEIEAARAGRLPQLVERSDLRGDLHVHHAWTLGSVGLGALAQAGAAAGLEYLALADRVRSAGFDAYAFAGRLAAIDAANAQMATGCTLLKGVEVEILEDGRLDLPAGLDLAGLDLVIGVVDRGFALPPVVQTQRLVRAVDHPALAVLAHPGNRLLDVRPASEFDLERVLRHAQARGCFVELDAQPQRLDLDEAGCRLARELGVLVSIGSEAQDSAGLADLEWGLGQARRGWLEAADVLNTRPLAEVRALLAAAMGRGSPGFPPARE